MVRLAKHAMKDLAMTHKKRNASCRVFLIARYVLAKLPVRHAAMVIMLMVIVALNAMLQIVRPVMPLLAVYVTLPII